MKTSDSYDKETLIANLCGRDDWSEGLLSFDMFKHTIEKVLSRREFFILEERIKNQQEGLTRVESLEKISKILKNTPKTVANLCGYIKTKFKHGMMPDPKRAFRRFRYVKGESC